MPEAQLPAPPVPADANLRGLPSMRLDVFRLRYSDIAFVADAEIFRCAVLSWCAAWHQVPAGSLPNDDVQLARLLGFGRDVQAWKRMREIGALRGWVLHADGRLYHEVIAEMVLETLARRAKGKALAAAAMKARRQRQFQERQAQQSDSANEAQPSCMILLFPGRPE